MSRRSERRRKAKGRASSGSFVSLPPQCFEAPCVRNPNAKGNQVADRSSDAISREEQRRSINALESDAKPRLEFF